MNCKPGDLAVMVHSSAQNEGAFVRIISWHGTYKYRDGVTSHDVWRVECLSHVKGNMGMESGPGDTRFIQDYKLRPIRDSGDDAQDEMLRPLPQEIAA